MKLQSKLLCATAGNVGIGVTATVAIVVAVLLASFPSWIASTENAMIGSETDNLARLSVEKAEYSDVYYARISSTLDGLCTFTEDLLRGAVNTTGSLRRYSTLASDYFNTPGWRTSQEASYEVTLIRESLVSHELPWLVLRCPERSK